MLKFFKILLPFFLITVSSCFTTRQTPLSKTTPNQNPVKLSIDTTTFPPDTLRATGQIQKTQADTAGNISDSLAIPLDAKKKNFVSGESTLIDSTTKDSTIISSDSIAFQADSIHPTDSLKTAEFSVPDTITIIGTGDIMPGTNYPDNRYLPKNCYSLFSPVKEILQSADITFGNLEGVFCSSGGTAKKCNDPSVCYVFRMPDEYLNCILDAGYDLLSVANNHVNDFGPAGRKTTTALLDSAGVNYAGFLSRPIDTFTVDNVKYGFAAFAPNIGTVSFKDYNRAAEIIRDLEKISDIVIVSFHGGAEGRDYQNVPCTDEIYLGYNRGNVCKFAHLAVEAGADIVFGHGPHVTRAMELYQNRLICYSLGNFCTYARFNLSGPNGIAPIVKVLTNPNGEFLGGEVISVYQPGEGGPRPDPQNRALKKLIELSNADFPDSELVIDPNGLLYRK